MLLRQKFFASVLSRQRFFASLWSLSRPEWVLSGVPCCLRVILVRCDFSGAVVRGLAGGGFHCDALWKNNYKTCLEKYLSIWVTHVTWMYPVNCSCKIVYASSFLLVDVYSILHTTVYTVHTHYTRLYDAKWLFSRRLGESVVLADGVTAQMVAPYASENIDALFNMSHSSWSVAYTSNCCPMRRTIWRNLLDMK